MPAPAQLPPSGERSPLDFTFPLLMFTIPFCTSSIPHPPPQLVVRHPHHPRCPYSRPPEGDHCPPAPRGATAFRTSPALPNLSPTSIHPSRPPARVHYFPSLPCALLLPSQCVPSDRLPFSATLPSPSPTHARTHARHRIPVHTPISPLRLCCWPAFSSIPSPTPFIPICLRATACVCVCCHGESSTEIGRRHRNLHLVLVRRLFRPECPP